MKHYFLATDKKIATLRRIMVVDDSLIAAFRIKVLASKDAPFFCVPITEWEAKELEPYFGKHEVVAKQ